MAGLPLVQRGESFQVEHSGSNFPNYTKPGQPSARGPEHTSIHVVNRIGFYVFSKDDIEHHFWTSDRVLQELGVRLYQPYLLNLFEEERVATWTDMPYELFNCIEKRGEDVKHWDATSEQRTTRAPHRTGKPADCP